MCIYQCSYLQCAFLKFVEAMGVRGRNGNDRLRTIWTPEMDRFFIALLLEQVSKGNKFDDHLFSKRAWKHMTSLFNAKFRFQYEKDVLKNRHKTLRNLFKAVKKLLDQKGFSWDENRQMVTADNNVWDEYIKIHPDARAYRIKTIPYYKDLCLIYGDANIEEKGDNLPVLLPDSAGDETISTSQVDRVCEGALVTFQEITVDEDYRISVTNVVIDDSASKELLDNVHQAAGSGTGSNRTRTYWQPPMDRYFIDLMLEHMRKGNQIDGVFRKQAWMDMITSFNVKFGFNYDVDVLKNRYKTLRRQYNVIKNLLELPGFAWDDTRQMVTADDYVWQDYIKTHTDARQFMTRPVPYYKDLCMICSDQNFDESDCFSAQCLELQNDLPEFKFPGASQSSQSPAASVSMEEIGNMHTSPGTIVFDQMKKRQSESQANSAHSKKARGKDEGMASALREMATAVSSLSDKRKDENSNSISIENVIRTVQALPDMDEELILDACDFLEDETKAKTFMALDVKLRKKWLMRKLRPEL
ncbi:L10-interacting MYB domain-containing protein isoform X1 [Manihot esculenta]|uniref:L10-interacting MYB domain-containing protein isoform X1 n=1 Tax=Manihot esculenta TaxID=3983 RepID=UPI000B5D487A|nr:L10-interacting MYB domain-containing protein isoform X1 [Manihot esculenta]